MKNLRHSEFASSSACCAEERSVGYPLVEQVPRDRLDAEAAMLARANARPFPLRLPVYLKLGGPGFMGAAATLGAGTLTSAMLSGSQFGYRLLWISWIAIGSGLFMMAAMARFTTRGRFPVIRRQRECHGTLIASFATAIIGIVVVAVLFNFGQFALGTHLIQSIGELAGISLPQKYNWIAYALLTAWLSLSYGRGRRGVALVENFMKLSLLLMVLCFAASLAVVGIDWSAAARGFFVPWLPHGAAGVDLFVASTAAAVGVMDWVFFQYAGLIKGWDARHESLARVDIVMGFAVPFIVITTIVICLFAATLHGRENLPQTASELSAALVPLLGQTAAELAFMVGFLAVPVTTSVIMGIACAIGIHEAFGWRPDVRSMRWVGCVLAPQIGFFGAFGASPLTLVIIIAAFLSLTNNIVGWPFYLMLNDPRVMGENRCRSPLWNGGILVQITLLNCVAIIYVFNRLGMWE